MSQKCRIHVIQRVDRHRKNVISGRLHMIRQLFFLGFLFVAGISFGALFTPVGMDIADQMKAPAKHAPTHQKQQSNSKHKPLFT